MCWNYIKAMVSVAEMKAQAKKMGYKGYSKMKKAELEKLLETPPPKPKRTKSKAEQAKNPVKKVQPPKKKMASGISGKNILFESKLFTKSDWSFERKIKKLKARDFIKGNKKDGAAVINPLGEEQSLYFIKNLEEVPLEKKGSLVELFDPTKDRDFSEKTKRAYKKGDIRVTKLTDKEVKDFITKTKMTEKNKDEIMGMIYYLNTPDVIKMAHPLLGVYKGQDSSRNNWYGSLFASVIFRGKSYEYRFMKDGNFVRDMVKTKSFD